MSFTHHYSLPSTQTNLCKQVAMTIRMLLSIWYDVYQSYVPCFVTEVWLKHETHQKYCPSQADAHVQAWRRLKLPHERQTTLKLLTDTTELCSLWYQQGGKSNWPNKQRHNIIWWPVLQQSAPSKSRLHRASHQPFANGTGMGHYKSGFCKEAPWSRNWVDHSCNSLWLGKVWPFNGAAILDFHHIGSKKIQKKQSQYASESESLITFSFSSLICQHLPIHPSPKTHRLPTTANILWRSQTIVTSCLAEVVLTECSPTDGIIKPMNPSLGRDDTWTFFSEEDACATRIQFLQVRKSVWICPFWPAHCHEHWLLSLSVLCIHLGNIAINIAIVYHIEGVLVNLIHWCKGANTLFC